MVLIRDRDGKPLYHYSNQPFSCIFECEEGRRLSDIHDKLVCGSCIREKLLGKPGEEVGEILERQKQFLCERDKNDGLIDLDLWPVEKLR